jgi:hypothetical protein
MGEWLIVQDISVLLQHLHHQSLQTIYNDRSWMPMQTQPIPLDDFSNIKGLSFFLYVHPLILSIQAQFHLRRLRVLLTINRSIPSYLFSWRALKKCMASVDMPTRNYDSSLLIERQRSKALYAFYQANQASLALGNSVLREQPQFQSTTVILQRAKGGCFCENDVSNNVFNFQGSGPCCGGS